MSFRAEPFLDSHLTFYFSLFCHAASAAPDHILYCCRACILVATPLWYFLVGHAYQSPPDLTAHCRGMASAVRACLCDRTRLRNLRMHFHTEFAYFSLG